MVPDPSKTIIESWGVRKVLGMTAERTTFLVDPNGLIAQVWEKVKVDGHAEDVYGTVQRLQTEASSG